MLIAKSTIKHNGDVFHKGESLPTMGNNEEQALLRAGVVELIEEKKPEPKKEDAKTEKNPEQDLKSLSKKKLLKLAKSKNIEANETMSKSNIVELLS